MSEIVLNYTGLDSVPGKIVFNKSEDYFEWLNRGKPKNVEECTIEVKSTTANGKYEKTPSSDNTYSNKVTYTVNVPRSKPITYLAFTITSPSVSYRSVITMDNITPRLVGTDDEFHDASFLNPYVLYNDDNHRTSSIEFAYTSHTSTGLTSDPGDMILALVCDYDNGLFEPALYSGSFNPRSGVTTYVARITPFFGTNEITQYYTLTWAFYDDKMNQLIGQTVNLLDMMNGTITTNTINIYSKDLCDYSALSNVLPELKWD